MIKSNAKDVVMHIDPLSWSASIMVLWGNLVQVGDGTPDGYMPSRKNVPCILLPIVHVSDPERIQDGRNDLVSVKWYIGPPKPDDGNLITASTPGFEVMMTPDEKYALKITKDVPPHEPMLIHCIYSFLDQRTGDLIDIEDQRMLRTVTYDANVYHLQLDDTPALTVISPLDEKDCGDAPWLHTLSVQAYSGKNKIPDEQVTYKWQIYDAAISSLRDFTADELQVLVKNQNTRTLTYDARLFSEAVFHCTARPKLATGTESPGLMQANCAVQVKMPDSLEVRTECVKGLRVGPRMDDEVSFECTISYNKGDIPEDKYGLFRIVWSAKSQTVGATVQPIGEGRTISFVPKNLGYTKGDHVRVWAEVKVRTHSALTTNATGMVITDAAGAAIIANIYQ